MEEFKLPFKQDQCKQPNVVDNVSRESLEYILNLPQNDLESLINKFMENPEVQRQETSAIEEVNQLPIYDLELSNKALIPKFSNFEFSNETAISSCTENFEILDNRKLGSQTQLDPELNLPIILSQVGQVQQPIVDLTSDDQYSEIGNSQQLNENNAIYEEVIQSFTPSQPLVPMPNSLLMYPRLNNEENKSFDSLMAPNLPNGQSLSSLVVHSSLIHSEQKTDDEIRQICKAVRKNLKSKQTKSKRLNEKKTLKNKQ